jgi:hypothetical protein
VVQEILNESLSAIWKARLLFLGLVAAAAVLLAAERGLRRRLASPHRRWVHATAAAGAVAAGLWLGWQQSFLCDDAYISFRYARNLAEGHGLVWNPGQWVEGYTNFLWTALLGGLGWLGADIPLAALLGCLASFVVALVASAAAVRRAAPRPPLLPFAAIALAGAVPFHTFATSGLETMPAAALVVVAMYAGTLRRGALLAGLALTAATLMRPDHVLFFGCFGLALGVEDLVHGKGSLRRRLDLRRYAACAAPFLLLYVPYYLLRFHAYGDFYPNTYYAKMGDLAYWSQGLVYAAHFIGSSGAWAWMPVAALAMLGRPRTRNETRLRAFAVLSVPVFAGYVAKVGGDFMEYRFFVPILPVVAVAAEVGLRWRCHGLAPGLRRGVSAAAAALGMAAAILPIHLIPARSIRWSISPEQSFYHVRSVWPLSVECGWEAVGKDLHAELTARGVRPPFAAAAIGILGYHSRLPIVDALGLTNRAIGHKPIGKRGRPGHEKQASTQELIEQGAVLDLGNRWDPFPAEASEARVGNLKFYFLRLDPRWANAIARLPGARVPDPEHDVDRLVRNAPREQVVLAAQFYRAFLAIHPLRDRLLGRIAARLGAIADFEDDIPAGAARTGKGLRVVHRDKPAGASGGGWLSSLPDTKGGIGRVEIPVGPLAADELRFVLGGSASERVRVRLLIDGKPVRQASPSGAPGLTPVAWDLSDLRGRRGMLVIEDANPARGVGLMVDAIHFAPTDGDVRERIAAFNRSKTDAGLGELLVEAEGLLPEGDPDLAKLEARVERRFTLDELPPGAALSGTAFGKGPVARALGDQRPVTGFQGSGFLNSYHDGNDATGRVELPLMELPREPISVLVAGGRNCNRVYVGLEVAGKVLKRVCGQNDDVLRREQLITGSYAGKQGRIVIVDEAASGSWGHIVADDVLVVRPRPGAP